MISLRDRSADTLIGLKECTGKVRCVLNEEKSAALSWLACLL
jgi:hypothetical protein